MASKFEGHIIGLHGDDGRRWLERLPEFVQSAAERWGLTDLTPYDNLSYHHVSAGFRGGDHVVLKLGPDHDALRKETAALKAFAGYGAVDVLAETDGALLLRRATPGHALKRLLPTHGNQALNIACGVMQKLHQAPLPKERFPAIKDWMDAFDHAWDLPANTLQIARDFKQRYWEDSRQVLLHGDLHHDNILANGTDWLVIDPKGVIGHPIHEIWAFIGDDIGRDTHEAAAFFEYETRRVRAWYFVHAVLAAIWNLQDGQSPAFFLRQAERVLPLVTA